MKTIDQAKIHRLRFEYENLISSQKDLERFLKRTNFPKICREIKYQINIIKIRIDELIRVLSILGINENEI